MTTPTNLCANCDNSLTERDWNGENYPYCAGCRSWWMTDVLEKAHKYRRPKPAGSDVSLVFEPNGTDHDDIVLRVGRWASRSDSYFYVLDKPAEQQPDTIRSIRAMLEQWKVSVVSAEEGKEFYLPHDFSDQYTGWLRGELKEDAVTLIAGISNREGWSFYPSGYSEVEQELSDFEPIEDYEAYTLSRAKLVADIELSIRALSQSD